MGWDNEDWHGSGHRLGRNGEFCVAVDPLTTLLAYWLIVCYSFLESNPRWIKAP